MKKWLVNSSLIFGSVFGSLLFCEIILRVIGFSNPRFYEYDSLLGYRPQSGAKGWFRKEGAAYISINSQGWRDREHSKVKPPDTVRVAILGDSYAEALQVPLQETFWTIMEQRLNTFKPFGAKQVEVLNFGVSGYGTAQAFLTLQHYVWEYSPDIVVLAFLTGNDLRNNSKALEPNKQTPFFVLQGEKLWLDTSFVKNLPDKPKSSRELAFRRLFYRYSRTYQLFNSLRHLSAIRQSEKRETRPGEEVGMDIAIYTEPKTPEWQEAWKITEALLVKMHTVIEQHQKRFVVVTLSNSIQVHPDREVRKRFMEKYNTNDLFYPDKRIKTFCAQQGIEVLTLAPLFLQDAEEHKSFLHGFSNSALGTGHWNAEGHRLAGEIIARYLSQGKTPL